MFLSDAIHYTLTDEQNLVSAHLCTIAQYTVKNWFRFLIVIINIKVVHKVQKMHK